MSKDTDRICKDCGAAFRGGPRSSYCPRCKQARDAASRARSYAKYKARRQRRSTVWDREKVVAAILERQRQGLPLNAGAVLIDDNPLLGAARRYCGGWNEALLAAGLRPAGIRLKRATAKTGRQTWTPEAVINAIRADAEAGLSLSCRATSRRSNPLVHAGFYYFGSWAEAVKAAGYDYSVARRMSQWTSEEVLERIHSLSEAGVDLSEASCRAWDPGLYGAATELFGSWDNALRAAGVDETQSSDEPADIALTDIMTSRIRYECGLGIGDAAIHLETALPENSLRWIRKTLGLSCRELGERVGVCRGTIERLERVPGANPRVSLALRLARALECSVEDIYGSEDGCEQGVDA